MAGLAANPVILPSDQKLLNHFMQILLKSMEANLWDGVQQFSVYTGWDVKLVRKVRFVHSHPESISPTLLCFV